MAEGLTNKQIADKLYISEGTVKNYISNIYDKTGIHDRVKLIVELTK
jgi:DNA-binding NarL/FixJ family response regulator